MMALGMTTFRGYTFSVNAPMIVIQHVYGLCVLTQFDQCHIITMNIH